MRGRRATRLTVIEGGLSEVPPPPSDLPSQMHGDWTICAADLQERGLLTRACLGVLSSYVTALWTMAECRKAIAHDGFFVKTKLGEPKPHPAHGMMSKAQDSVARLAAELGLSPAARSRKALQGEPKPDEAATLWSHMDL